MAKQRHAKRTGRESDQFIVRLPDGMREKLASTAESNGRSMTAEVVAALEEHFSRKDRLSVVEDRISEFQAQLLGIRLRLGKLEKEPSGPTDR